MPVSGVPGYDMSVCGFSEVTMNSISQFRHLHFVLERRGAVVSLPSSPAGLSSYPFLGSRCTAHLDFRPFVQTSKFGYLVQWLACLVHLRALIRIPSWAVNVQPTLIFVLSSRVVNIWIPGDTWGR